MSLESIFGNPPGASRCEPGRPFAAGDDSEIDYSDIPPLTDEQLTGFRRAPKVLVAARLDRGVYDWLKTYGEGYSTLINNILRTVTSRAR